MPELPEVETVRAELEAALVGRTIENASIFERRLRAKIPLGITESLKHARILAVGRRAKYLLIDTTGPRLLSHLGMTGTWRLEPAGWQRRKHDHVALALDTGVLAVFADPRRFGLFTYAEGSTALSALGVEPLSDEFSVEYLLQACRGRDSAIKPLIMNQQIVVGVGNIYASEALFRAGISPKRPARRLPRARLAALVTAVKNVLNEALCAGGSSTSDYRRVNGASGRFQDQHMLYGRAGAPCRRCGAIIRTLKQAGRSTFYCPKCQR